MSRQCLPTLGFVVLHTPGVARAWQYEFPDGSSLLVTDAEGFDLPHPNGPYSIIHLSRRDELLDVVPLLLHPKDVYRFIRRQQRHFAWQRINEPLKSQSENRK